MPCLTTTTWISGTRCRPRKRRPVRSRSSTQLIASSSRRSRWSRGTRMSLLKFFLFTFALTWTCFFTAVALAGGSLAVLVSPLVLLGTFAPSLVALALTASENGRPGVEALLQRLFQWRVGLRWYVFALSYMAAVKLTVALADRMILGAWPGFGPPSPSLILPALLLSTPVQSGEEIGWRGYALPRMAERSGFARASVLLGVIWAAWHLPLFFLRVPGNEEYAQSFPVWA